MAASVELMHFHKRNQDSIVDLQQQIDQPVQQEVKGNRINRNKIKCVFDQFDKNNDGRLSIKELKNMIKTHQTTNLPKGLSEKIMKMADTDGNGYLEFEEFFALSQTNKFFMNIATNYCRFIVPRRDGTQATDEIDGAYEREFSCWPPPLTMVTFSILEAVIFVADIYSNKNAFTQTGEIANYLIYSPRKREEIWRFLTYMFVHVGLAHLLMNWIVQLLLGIPLELVHSWWRVSLIYLSGVLAGSMGSSLVSPNIYLAGASGGVYALMTAHIATIIMNWKEMKHAFLLLVFFVLYVTSDLVLSIYQNYSKTDNHVGYIAHLSGGIAGLLVGIGVLRNLKVHSWEKTLWWISVTFFLVIMGGGICFHIFKPEYFL